MPILDQSAEISHPAPGVTLLCLPEDRFKRVIFRVHFDRPLDPLSPARTLLAEVLQQGTATRPSRKLLAQAMEERYAATLAMGSDRIAEAQRSTLSLDWVGSRFLPAGNRVEREMLDLGRELLEKPAPGPGGEPFAPETLERERAQLIRHIESLQDDRSRYASEKFLAALCEGEPLGTPPYGDPQIVEQLQAEDLETARSDLLTRASVTAVAVGPVRKQTLHEFLADWFGQEAADRQDIPTPVWKQPQDVREMHEHLSVDQARMLFGWRFTPPGTQREFEALALANSLLGGGAHGRLFRIVREERSQAYGIYSWVRSVKGILTVEAGIDAQSFDSVRNEIHVQIEAIAKGEFHEEEVDVARINTLNSLHGIGDSAVSMARFFGLEYLRGFQRTPAQRAQDVQSITREEIMQAAAGWKPDLVYLLSAAPVAAPATS